MCQAFELQEKAKMRMMKQKDSDKHTTYWDNAWGKSKNYDNTGKEEFITRNFSNAFKLNYII